MEAQVTKKVKRKLSFKGLIVILLSLYLLAMFAYVIYKMPVKSIVILGNSITSNKEIISTLNLDEKTAIWPFSQHNAIKKLKALDFISDAKIKKSLSGKLTIELNEERVLFYDATEEKYVLSNMEKVASTKKVNGIPTLINFVPSDKLKDFVTALKKQDDSIIKMISEIEYKPNISGEVTIDDERFLLKMNDENSVYINIVNLDKLSKYKEIIASLDDGKKGLLYLDSYLSGTIFEPYDKINKDKEEKEALEHEKEDVANGELSQ